jgi:hypothetical protein
VSPWRLFSLPRFLKENCPLLGTLTVGLEAVAGGLGDLCAFYVSRFYAWWFHFPQSGALAEGTSRPCDVICDGTLCFKVQLLR